MRNIYSPCTLMVAHSVFRFYFTSVNSGANTTSPDVTAPSLGGSGHSKMLHEAGEQIIFLHVT